MVWILILLVALNLAGFYFNLRMLLSCFKSDTKRAFVQTYRPLVICQFVYQVSVLAMNTIEAWGVLDIQHDGFCSVFKIMTICINIFLVSNLITILLIAAYHPVVYKNRYLSPELLMLVPVCLGFIGSVVFWLCSCMLHQFEFQVVAIIFCVVLLVLLFLNWKKLGTPVGAQLNRTSENLKTASSLWDTLKENKKACFVTAWLAICCGVVLAPVQARGILPGVFLREFDMMMMFMITSVVGIALPAILTCLFHSTDNEDDEMETIAIL